MELELQGLVSCSVRALETELQLYALNPETSLQLQEVGFQYSKHITEGS